MNIKKQVKICKKCKHVIKESYVKSYKKAQQRFLNSLKKLDKLKKINLELYNEALKAVEKYKMKHIEQNRLIYYKNLSKIANSYYNKTIPRNDDGSINMREYLRLWNK